MFQLYLDISCTSYSNFLSCLRVLTFHVPNVIQSRPLTVLGAEEMDLEQITSAFNLAMNDAAKTILGKKRHVKKPWVTPDILDACDERQGMKIGDSH